MRARSAPIELGGPEAVTWSDLWRRLKAALGTRRPADPRAVLARARPRGAVRAHASGAPDPRPAADARRPRQRRHATAEPPCGASGSATSSGWTSSWAAARAARTAERHSGRRSARVGSRHAAVAAREAGRLQGLLRRRRRSPRRESARRIPALREKNGRGPPWGGPRTFGDSVGFGRGASSLTEVVGGARARVPYAWLWRFPVGPGDTPLPAGTSTAGTTRI